LILQIGLEQKNIVCNAKLRERNTYTRIDGSLKPLHDQSGVYVTLKINLMLWLSMRVTNIPYGNDLY